jgi:hypothetical protein
MEGIMSTLQEFAMRRMWESIAKDDVKEAAFWLTLLADDGKPKSLSETAH